MNVSMELSNKDLLKNQLIKEVNSLSQDQIKKLLMIVIDWCNDKRNHAREAKNFMGVTYWDDTKRRNGFIRDLSPGGSFIEPAGAFSLGQHITIKFHHSSVDGPIEIEGEIVRREKCGIGVKFSNEIKVFPKGI